MNVIDLKQLTLTYPGYHFYQSSTQILENIELQVAAGEAVGLVGPNGAGKTTFFRTLLGLLTPTSGTIRLFNRSAQDPSVHTLLGYLPEQPAFYPFMTAPELLRTYAKLYEMPHATERIHTVLKQVNLEGVHQKISTFSKGMLQRLGIAQAILHDPPLLLLDEPFSGLDPVGRSQMHEMLQALRTKGKTILFSTHNLHDVETICDRVAIIRNRRLETTRHIHELLTETLHGIQIIIEGNEVISPLLKSIPHTTITIASHLIVTLPTMKDFNQVMNLVNQHKANVISIHTIRQSLEEYFAQHTENEV